MSKAAIKQPEIYRLFSKLIKKETLQHAYLLEGQKGTGKKETALWVAKALFCLQSNEDGSPCGECNQCMRIETHQHPDVIEVAPQGLSIKVDQVRELKKEFSKSGMEGRKKVIIIDDAEKMTASAANSLLKFLEEPEGELTAFLLTSSKQNLLPTIISRCQVLPFKAQSPAVRLEELKAAGLSVQQAAVLSRLTQSSEEALRLNEELNLSELVETIWQWWRLIVKRDAQAFVFVETTVMAKVSNREEHHLILDLLLFLYEDLLVLYFKDSNHIAFYKYKDELKKTAGKLSSKRIAESLTIILEAKKKLNSNVSAQAVFEDTCLRLIEEQ